MYFYDFQQTWSPLSVSPSSPLAYAGACRLLTDCQSLPEVDLLTLQALYGLGLCSLWQLPILLCHTKMLPHRLFPREICQSRTEIQRPSQARINYDIKPSLERDQANSQLCKAFDHLPSHRPLKLNEVKNISLTFRSHFSQGKNKSWELVVLLWKLTWKGGDESPGHWWAQ